MDGGDAAPGDDASAPDAGSDAGRDAGAPDAGEESVCGNGIVEPGEPCDDGDSDDGDGCDADCTPSCTSDAECDDADPCTAPTTCEDRTCRAPLPAPDGTACADGVCRGGVCAPAYCGDGTRTDPEFCDDANAIDGDGCDTDCTASCTVDGDCDDSDPCDGVERCMGSVCAPGTPPMDGTLCDADADASTRDVCMSGACRRSFCGDGFADPGSEACDDGNLRDGDGCDRDCTITCASDSDCDDADVCNGAESCGAMSCTTGTPPPSGTACGAGSICNVCCRASACGDGVRDAAREACDDGNSVNGDGCDNDCTASCRADSDCGDGRSCNGVERCVSQVCQAGTAAADGTSCDLDGNAATIELCRAGGCTAARCGDGIVSSGEACDDGNAIMNDGCDNDCTRSCTASSECDDAEPCNGAETCAAGRCTPGTFSADGASCGVPLVEACRAGRCAPSTCGDGTVAPTEECDDRNRIDGDGCENDCTLTCASDAECSDGEPCNGAERCAMGCVPGTPLADGAACGANVCVDSACRAPRCGDGVVSSGEACDDGNTIDGDGCDGDCTASCGSDAACDDGEACNGAERCVAGRCAAGAARADGQACPTGLCDGGACRAPRCGDGVVSSGEACDDGDTIDGDGCDCDCTFSCTTAADCDDREPCDGVESCSAARTCAEGAPLADGAACDLDADASTSERCFMGRCGRTRCGDGIVEAPAEECDDGNAISGDGCEADCSRSCASDGDCDDGRACDGAERCVADACVEGTPLADGTDCDLDASIEHCVGGVCRRSVCGDGIVDPRVGEECEAPAAGCDPRTCRMIMSMTTCGNGAIEGTEHCDDGNTARWDGCDAICRLEQTVRSSSLVLLEGTRGCDLDGDGTPDNAIGSAMSDFVRDQANAAIGDAVTNGDIHMLSNVLDLDDRLGRNDASIAVALFSGTDAAAPFDGSRGERFAITADQLDAMRMPAAALRPAQIVMTALSAGPSDLAAPMGSMMFGSELRRARVSGTVVADTTLRRVDRVINGMLCGAVDAAQLDMGLAPEMVPASCRGPETSMLDLLVLGCRLGVTPLVNPTQPDIDLDGDGLYAGARLSDTDGDFVVDHCVDGRTGTVIDGDDCAQDPRFDDAFSQAIAFEAYWVLISEVR